ncbi:MAG: DNA repair protein RadA [Candidatus Eremiobacteraeota bacterium]|nr:DNA repair protein RadA [Candidatus Eremiobacteraeota bacterium]
MKTRTIFVCQECGAQVPRWQGRCNECGGWNTFVEEVLEKDISSGISDISGFEPLQLVEIKADPSSRIKTGISEFDRVLGGGLTRGSMVLIGGAPGIGKSTLLLQVADKLAFQKRKVLYITGEESQQQVHIRAERMGLGSTDLYIYPEINLESIENQARILDVDTLIIDSIQTLFKPGLSSAPGSVTQVRECASDLFRLCKTKGITTLIVGHVTKDGSIAGPRVLEHIVDTVLSFEGEGFQSFRILKAIKNRFGNTREIGIFEMRENGLVGISNPSEFFLSQRSTLAPGAVIMPVMEGSRPVLVEIQALVTRSTYGIPARRASGLDLNRLQVLLAVLERRGRLALGGADVYLNVAGGMSVEEPAADLGILLAVASAAVDRSVDSETVVIGEIGLGGEIRAVTAAEHRLREAARLGFKKAIIPAYNIHRSLTEPEGITLIGVENIREALKKSLPGSHNKRGGES